jgi:hypothetical protein
MPQRWIHHPTRTREGSKDVLAPSSLARSPRVKLSLLLAAILAATTACTAANPNANTTTPIPVPSGYDRCSGPAAAPVGWDWVVLHVKGSEAVKEAIMTVTLTSTTVGGSDPRDLPHGIGYPVPWCMFVVYKPGVKVRILLYAQVPIRYQDEVFYCEVYSQTGKRIHRQGTDRAGHITCDYTTS